MSVKNITCACGGFWQGFTYVHAEACSSEQQGAFQGRIADQIGRKRGPVGRTFGTIYADPPWPEHGGGKVKRGADRHYGLMKVKDICALGSAVKNLAADDSHLYLWVTNNYLPAGLEVMKAWGFDYVTNVCWGKVRLEEDDGFGSTIAIQQGLGQYFRGAHELLLFGKRGQPPYRTLPNGKRAQHPSLVLHERTKHSAKPETFRDIITKVSHGPYLELFARERVPGWSSWGNELPFNDVTMGDAL